MNLWLQHLVMKNSNFDEAQDIAGFTLKYREDPIFLDPRNKNLGARLIINLEKLYLSLKKLDLQNAIKRLLFI